MQLAQTLRSSIDAWTDRLWQESRLAQLARQGALPEHALALYLESLRFLFRHSHLNLIAAEQHARALGETELADVFGRKAAEERGHDQWASRDLSGLSTSAVSDVVPAAASRRLVELQRELTVQHHPLCFFAYSLWAEYMTVRLGDAWLNALANNGYARTSVTCVANHVEADREHAAAGFDVLDALWHGQPERALILTAVDRAQQLFESFCNEIAAAAQRGTTSHVDRPIPSPTT
jgi:hypothetical protein